MTLTEMIKAHDGGSISDELRKEISARRQIAANSGVPQELFNFWLFLISAIEGDLNAAWRLLAPGWKWILMVPEFSGWAAECFDGENVYLLQVHKSSLPCAMVLAALQAWEIE